MKHTTRKLLALLLVLTMAIGMVPFSVLTVGATGTSGSAVVSQGVQFVADEDGEDALESFTLDIRQVSVPTLSLENGSGVLNFLTKISKAGYQNLVDKIDYGAMGAATLSFGTLIASQSDVIEMNGELTHASANADTVDVSFGLVFNGEGAPIWYKEDAEFGYIVGSKTIAAGDHATDYIAVGYAKLTIDNENYYAYAKNADEKGTSLYELAIRALNDVSDERDADHKFQIDNGLYAAHTVKQRKALLAFIQNVIEVETSASGFAIEFVEYEGYNPICDPSVVLGIARYEKMAVNMTNPENWDLLLNAAGLEGNDDITLIYAVTVEAAEGVSLDGLSLVLDGIKVAGAPIQVGGVNCYLFGIAEYAPNY